MEDVQPVCRASAVISAILLSSHPMASPTRTRIGVSELLNGPSPNESSNMQAKSGSLPPPSPLPVSILRSEGESRPLVPLGQVPTAPEMLPHISGNAKRARLSIFLKPPVHKPSNPNLTAFSKRTTEDYRYSHKIAERRRRREMQEVFERLAAALPPSSPRSKWELLVDTLKFLDSLENRKATLMALLKSECI
jgi:hypothetical protein